MSQRQTLTLILVGGSLRSQSVNAAVLATACEVAPASAKAVVYRRLGELPHFNPDNDCDPFPEPVADLRRQLGGADAVLFSTPEYAGSLPGSFKNLLDWTVGAGSLYRRPVGWINPSAHRGSQETYRALRIVLDRAGTEIVEGACLDVPVPRDAVGVDGVIMDAEIRAAIGLAVEELLAAAKSRERALVAEAQA